MKNLLMIFNTLDNLDEFVTYFDTNNWFGVKPTKFGNAIMVNDNDYELLKIKAADYLLSPSNYDIEAAFEKKYPSTFFYFNIFSYNNHVNTEDRFYIIDFLLYYMTKELKEYNNEEMDLLFELIVQYLIKDHGNILTFFIAHLKTRTRVRYTKDYVLNNRYTMVVNNTAYNFEEYLELNYYLLNIEYIEENHMYEKAAESKNYTDTWLWLCIHFTGSLRLTDLERIFHPILPCSPEQVIEKVKEGTFSDADAIEVLESIYTKLNCFKLTPNKTSSHSGISNIRFHIPTSCQTHFGILIALAEAHRQIAGCPKEPLFVNRSSYETIKRSMGEEIGNLFLYSNFRSRSATKSYLQALYMLSDDILDEYDGQNIKGYIIAAYARSHKGSYGSYASTTFEYLNDAKFNGMTPDFIIFELFERGVMSFAPSMLMKMMLGKSYDRLPISNQTKLIQNIGLTNAEIEGTIALVSEARSKAEGLVKSIVSSDADILTALHRIASGEATSKQSECLCLRTALGQSCNAVDRRGCIGCEYEISTRSTLFLMAEEIKRMKSLFSATSNTQEKLKYKRLIKETLIPKIEEILLCIKENYGEKDFETYQEIVRKELN